MHQLAIGMVNFTFNFHLYLGLFTHCAASLVVDPALVYLAIYKPAPRHHSLVMPRLISSLIWACLLGLTASQVRIQSRV